MVFRPKLDENGSCDGSSPMKKIVMAAIGLLVSAAALTYLGCSSDEDCADTSGDGITCEGAERNRISFDCYSAGGKSETSADGGPPACAAGSHLPLNDPAWEPKCDTPPSRDPCARRIDREWCCLPDDAG
jgi:hypothetical protein